MAPPFFTSIIDGAGYLHAPALISQRKELPVPIGKEARRAQGPPWNLQTKQTPWPLFRERTIPTDRPPLVDEI
jgi:hypothetical protein